ncbi:hypothetical protein B0A50_05169 [Salinomyces thailandicus]|uniref:NYN domain-containing protein n=1 Tax=Salinomyces thailandicus TaxID=706561 RepID=A0A4U0TX55_9PEZI|nr:hypothetical protein B0A50_05169 [Salinomyces thailandica]
MTTRTQAKPWDFSHVLDLVNTLSTKDGAANGDKYQPPSYGTPAEEKQKPLNGTDSIATKDFGVTPSKLGDFAKLWQYLGSPLDSEVPEVPQLTNENETSQSIPAKADYTSDGATYIRSARFGKGVSWQDEASADEPTTDAVTDRSVSPASSNLTKTQRKKLRRKERRAQEAANALKNATVSESEADPVKKTTPARTASAHFGPAMEAYPRFSSSGSRTSAKTVTPKAAKSAAQPNVTHGQTPTPSIQEATARVAAKLAELKQGPQTPSKANAASPSKTTFVGKVPNHAASAAAPQRIVSSFDGSQIQQVQQWPVPGSKPKAAHLTPASVRPPRHIAGNTVNASAFLASPQQSPLAKKSGHIIEPKIVRSGEDRHWALLMKLIGDFWTDRKYLISPMNLTTHNNDPKGIHVFVDASNIFIGFTDQLKHSRNIPPRVHVPQVHLSFDGLALLMERRRPVCKRVLVGSSPHLPAFDKAKAVGYECGILEKVYKARELTERQIYFNTHDKFGRPLAGAKAPAANGVLQSYGSPPKNGGYMSSGSGSGSETTAPQYAPARMIEQGVDEILHLKMLESIVDTETPATIVLATGDAAQAEYSSGFMAMVERALKKGWSVELVSWSKNISQMYTRREWVQTWGERFRVIYLDDYAEELLEM